VSLFANRRLNDAERLVANDCAQLTKDVTMSSPAASFETRSADAKFTFDAELSLALKKR
jgi:hypothetical protein